jgi:hypothetical protein
VQGARDDETPRIRYPFTERAKALELLCADMPQSTRLQILRLIEIGKAGGIEAHRR